MNIFLLENTDEAAHTKWKLVGRCTNLSKFYFKITCFSVGSDGTVLHVFKLASGMVGKNAPT